MLMSVCSVVGQTSFGQNEEVLLRLAQKARLPLEIAGLNVLMDFDEDKLVSPT